MLELKVLEFSFRPLDDDLGLILSYKNNEQIDMDFLILHTMSYKALQFQQRLESMLKIFPHF